MFTSKPNLKQAYNALKSAKPKTRIGKWLAGTYMDERGVAAVEFALIAPVMLGFYFGVTEISLLVEADRNVSHATSMIGDLTAQSDVITADMIENYIYAALAVLDVDAIDATKVGIELYAFETTSNAAGGNPRVDVETGFATFGPAFDGGTHFDPSTIQDRILNETSGVVVARVNFEYNSKVSTKFVSKKTLRETYILKPRRSAIVQFDNENGNANPALRKDINCTFATNSGVSTANCAAAAGGAP